MRGRWGRKEKKKNEENKIQADRRICLSELLRLNFV